MFNKKIIKNPFRINNPVITPLGSGKIIGYRIRFNRTWYGKVRLDDGRIRIFPYSKIRRKYF